MTPALIKDQNKVLRYTPRVNEEIGQKAKNDKETNNGSKGFTKQCERKKKIGTAAKLQGRTSPFKMSITVKDRRPKASLTKRKQSNEFTGT